MTEEDAQPIRFKSQVKENFDLHLPMNIAEGIKCNPGDWLMLEVVPSTPVRNTPDYTSHEAEAKQSMMEADELGVNTFNYLLPQWIENVRHHLFYLKEQLDLNPSWVPKSIDDVPVPDKDRFGIVIGAGPSLKETTDEQWEALRNFDGCIVATNKALIPLVEHGIVPEWVVALDSDDVVFKSFDSPILDTVKGKVNFLGATVLRPDVVKFVTDWAKECYWGNPHMPSGQDTQYWNVNLILELLNGLPVLHHGGNVGTAAWLLAKKIRCNPIGMYGFNMCTNPDKTWTRDKAVDYEYIYNPENEEVLALDGPFRAYVSILVGVTDQAWNESPPITTVNLTPKGALFMSGFIPNITLTDFVENKEVIQRADQDRKKSLARISERLAIAKEAMKPIFRTDEF